jgi:hypothetical protein
LAAPVRSTSKFAGPALYSLFFNVRTSNYLFATDPRVKSCQYLTKNYSSLVSRSLFLGECIALALDCSCCITYSLQITLQQSAIMNYGTGQSPVSLLLPPIKQTPRSRARSPLLILHTLLVDFSRTFVHEIVILFPVL